MGDSNWIKSEITYFLIKNYGYTRCKLTPKIQEIDKSQNGSELNNLFTDIQLILSIPVKFMPDDLYLFIGEIFEKLENNKKNIVCAEYLKKIVILLDDIPDFEERFTEILKKYNRDNVLIIFTKIIGEILKKKKDVVIAQLSQSGQLSKSLPPKLNQNTIQNHTKTSLFKSFRKDNNNSKKHNCEYNQLLETEESIKNDKNSLFRSLPLITQKSKLQKQQHNSLFVSKKFNTNYKIQETEEKELKRKNEKNTQLNITLLSKSLPTTKQTVKQSDKPKSFFSLLRKTSTNPLESSNGIGQLKISTISLQNNPESQQIQLMTKIKQETKEQMKSKKLDPLRMQLIPDEQLSMQMTLKKERKEEKEEDKKKEIKEELMGLFEDFSDMIEEFDDVSQKSSRSKSPDDDR